MAGLKSLLAPWMGGTSAVPGQTPSIQAGYRSMFAFWMGGTSAVPGQTPSIQAGYRSMFVFWMGGGVAGLTPVTPQIITRMPGGGGPDLSDTPDHTVNNNIILLMAIAFMETQ